LHVVHRSRIAGLGRHAEVGGQYRDAGVVERGVEVERSAAGAARPSPPGPRDDARKRPRPFGLKERRLERNFITPSKRDVGHHLQTVRYEEPYRQMAETLSYRYQNRYRSH